MSGRLSLGLYGPTYFGGFNPFLNWWKIGDEPTITRTAGGNLSGKAIWDAGTYFAAATGEIVNPAPADLLSLVRIFFTNPGAGNISAGWSFDGMQWTVKWDGKATCVVGGLTAGGSQTINNAAGAGIFTMGTSPGNTWLTFTLTDLNDPPRNIRVYQTSYAANMDAGEKFNPDWLEQITPFGVLRFMGWMPTNDETITNFSEFATESYTAWCKTLKATSGFGPKGSVPLSLICTLANVTGCNIHVCIPHLATDACVQSMAEFFRDNTTRVVTFEYSNECWNFQFQQTIYCSAQGVAIWGAGDGGRYSKFYGYRSAQCMKIIRDVYANRARWRGCLATQTVSATVTTNALIGVDYFRANELAPANSLTVTDLFNEVDVTGYFGEVQGSVPITGITKANPGVVTSASHGYSNGQRIKLFISAGMTELNNTFQTIANVAANTYELSGTNTTAMTTYASGNNYAHKAAIFDLMDASNSNFISNPAAYPNKYTYFNQSLATSIRTGAGGGFTTSAGGTIAGLRDTYWPAQKAVAVANGLDLRQYEGGLHYVGDAYLSGFGGNAQFTEYLLALGHSADIAAVYTESYNAFITAGGDHPSKFVEGGQTSQFGTWAGIRFIPGDENNPVWVAVVTFNGPEDPTPDPTPAGTIVTSTMSLRPGVNFGLSR